jgi:hypothetical protein
MANQDDLLPQPPKFSEEDMRRCKETGDYAPVLFEWYKFVGSLSAVVGHIQLDSPAFRRIRPQHYHILIGLLNRCARLMLANIALSQEGKFGETTAIVDRCIFESAVKICWLCENPSQEKFNRYLAEGLKTELEFKAKIESNIAERGGKVLPIETRMLRSIANCIADSELSESEILSAKRLPDMAAMLDNLGTIDCSTLSVKRLVRTIFMAHGRACCFIIWSGEGKESPFSGRAVTIARRI